MIDREKIIKGLECCLGSNDCDIEPEEDCPYKGMCLCAMALRFDVLALLKEQKSWTNEIAEYQQSISSSGMHELDDYEKGKWDGLQIAWNIISEGR